MEITDFDSKYHSNIIEQNKNYLNNFYQSRMKDANNPSITNIIPPSSWRYNGENGMYTDNVSNDDKYDDLFKLQVIKNNDVSSFNEVNNNFTPFDNKIDNNIKECFSMNTKKRDFEQFNDYNEQTTPLKLDIYSGSSRNYLKKTEIEPFFQPVKDMSYVNGAPAITNIFENRYSDSLRLEKRNEKPFEPKQIGPNNNNKYTGYHDTTRVLPKLTDELRRLDKPKISYTNEPIKGKNNINKRSVIPPLIKRGPEKFKNLNQDDLIPKSQISSAAIRDNYNLVLSNRSLLSKEMIGVPKDQTLQKFDLRTSGIPQESTRNIYIEPNNQNISGLTSIYNNNKNSINLPELERNDYQIDYNTLVATSKSQSFNPNDNTKPTIRQTLDNLDYSNIIATSKSQSFNPNDNTKPTIRQTLDNLDYSNIIATSKSQSFNPNDNTKPTIRQTLDNLDYNNIVAASKVQSFNPNDNTKPTIRQTLDNFDYSNIVAASKIETFNPNDSTKPTIRQTLDNFDYSNIQKNKNNQVQLSDKAKTTSKETVNIDFLNKYSNMVLNKKNISNLSDKAKITLKQILENIDYSNIQNNINKQISEFQDIAKNTQQLPEFNNENISTSVKNIKITNIEKLRNTIRELTNFEIITAPCSTDTATTTYLSDLAKITNKETILYEENGNLQGIEGSFVNTYEPPNVTLKELLDYNDYLSISKNNHGTYAYDPNDIAKTTNKEDTISFNYDNPLYNPISGGYQTESYDIQNTFKDITKIVDYVNNPNISYGNVLKDNYLNAQLNRVKEEIIKNRKPTPVGNFNIPTSDNINVMLKEMPNFNYIPPPRINKTNNSIDEKINMMMKNMPYFNDRIDPSLNEQLKTNNIVNNMVHKAIN